MVACDVMTAGEELLVVTEFGYGKRTKLSEFPRKGRGGKGVIAARPFKPDLIVGHSGFGTTPNIAPPSSACPPA